MVVVGLVVLVPLWGELQVMPWAGENRLFWEAVEGAASEATGRP